MSKDVSGIMEVLEVLKAHHVIWFTVNRIENSLWETGFAFFGKDYQRVAYYNEMQKALTIH